MNTESSNNMVQLNRFIKMTFAKGSPHTELNILFELVDNVLVISSLF